MTKLPLPTQTEIQTHNILVEKLREYSEANDNWISFSKFMEVVLYDKADGYYIKKNDNFGVQGDFITAPMISNLFAETFLMQFQLIFNHTNSIILECGPGNGFFCRDIMLAAKHRKIQIDRYYLLEVGIESVKKQKKILQECLTKSDYKKIQWVNEIPVQFDGVVFMNEFIDALPIDIFLKKNKKIVEKGLTFDNGRLIWKYKNILPLTIPSEWLSNLKTDYLFEHSSQYEKWIKQLDTSIYRGAVIIADYGFSHHEFFHPDRHQGTIMCHYRHLAHFDPLVNLGSQDITSHVNFSYLAKLFSENNFLIEAFQSQANFLLNNGILRCLAKYDPHNTKEYLKKTMGLQKLLSPSEMGDLVKVLVISKNIEIDFSYLNSQDKSFQL